MSALVLDSSVTLAWLFADERTPAVLDVRGLVIELGASVPALWHLEVANALTSSVRRGRISSTDRDESLADLGRLSIEVDRETSDRAWTTTLRIADRFRLTMYDASYLELATRSGSPLATLDAPLRAAASAMDVPTLGS